MTEENGQLLYFKSRADWRRWLQKNHANNPQGVWLLLYKIATGIPSITLAEATEEALCFGWIDGRLYRIDDEKYRIKFVPRRKNSIWSLINRTRAERLIKEGKMTPAGMAKIEEAKRNGAWDNAYSMSLPQEIPSDLSAALSAEPQAQATFNKLSPGRRFQYIYWINGAKTEATRLRRITKVLELTSQTPK